jgi:Methyltransferase domain
MSIILGSAETGDGQSLWYLKDMCPEPGIFQQAGTLYDARGFIFRQAGERIVSHKAQSPSALSCFTTVPEWNRTNDTSQIGCESTRHSYPKIVRNLTVQPSVSENIDVDNFVVVEILSSERLFQHLREPDRALAEMLRVTKPGGWIVVVDTDTATVSIDSDEIELERRLCRFYSDHRVWNGYSGRQLYRRFKQQKMRDINVEIAPVYITDYGCGVILTTPMIQNVKR